MADNEVNWKSDIQECHCSWTLDLIIWVVLNNTLLPQKDPQIKIVFTTVCKFIRYNLISEKLYEECFTTELKYFF